MPLRRRREHLQKQTSRHVAFIASKVDKSKSDTQPDPIRHERKPAFEHSDGLVETADLAELLSQFEKSQREHGPPHRRPAQLLERLVGSTGGVQRHGQQGFSPRLLAAPHRSLQQIYSLLDPVLQHKGFGQNLRGHHITPVSLEHHRRESLGVIGALRSQRDHGVFQRRIDDVRPLGAWRWALRHRSPH
ncbi:MAG: hypothetical protein A2790_08170 [Phenylobacterium sp. RIFCSPHIGHO2_01_FULL_69_31]|nr:MAG: hypothetical protein A2790_08170 [Phenylobacterium sp. RIFCSPHIGHO2_01_FULL_69_31]